MVTTKVRCHSVPYLCIYDQFLSLLKLTELSLSSVLFLVRSIFILHPGCLVGSFNLKSLSFREIILNHFFSDSSCVHSFFHYRTIVTQMLDFQDWLSKFLFSLFFLRVVIFFFSSSLTKMKLQTSTLCIQDCKRDYRIILWYVFQELLARKRWVLKGLKPYRQILSKCVR